MILKIGKFISIFVLLHFFIYCKIRKLKYTIRLTLVVRFFELQNLRKKKKKKRIIKLSQQKIKKKEQKKINKIHF